MKISKEAYDALVWWRNQRTDVGITSISLFPDEIDDWWLDHNISEKERNNRLIAIIRWVNGEDVFEIEKPKKWVIRSKDRTKQGGHLYVMLDISQGVKKTASFWDKDIATKFDTKEEAESWANAHQEVIEVEE